MSLAWRILLLALLLNVATVGFVQIVVHVSQQRWLNEQREAVEATAAALAFEDLERVYRAESIGGTGSSAEVTRRLLADRSIRKLYEDVVVTNGLPPYEVVYLNLNGAVHRDPGAFQQRAIELGMEQARLHDGVLPVADGYCRALRQGAQVVGYLWFKPKVRLQLPTQLPLWTSIGGVAAATLLFGLVLFWVTRAAIRSPLQAIGSAAAAVAEGRYDVRVPEGGSVPELEPLLRSFNHMAAKVRDHTRTLEDTVREAVEATKQKERALVLSSRLASIGTLAAGVAHEINNPIGGMQNAVNRLLQAPDLAPRQRTYLQLVQDGLQRIARTARRLLDFSPRQVPPGRFALAAAVDGARALIEHRVQRSGIALDIDVPADLPAAFGDAHEIQQVVLNLLINSLDVMEPQRRGRIHVHAHGEAGRLHLHVDDDGPGLAPPDLGRVFDPFFSKKDRPDASGLGLFICFSIVRNHGGEIAVDSSLGAGFRVHVTLPCAPA